MVRQSKAISQFRPRALWRVALHRDRKIRQAWRWCYGVGRRVWHFEVREFLAGTKRRQTSSKLHDFWGEPDEEHEVLHDLGHRPPEVFTISG